MEPIRGRCWRARRSRSSRPAHRTSVSVSSTTRSSRAVWSRSTASVSACPTAPRTRSSPRPTSASTRSSQAWRNTATLRQLARLTRPLPAAGPRACAISVYADGDDLTLAARDKGFEGVACVDDAARAVVLFLDLWRETGDDRLREWATGLLDFVLFMQGRDGRFHNFVRSWDGTIKEGVLADAAIVLDRPDLLAIARRSARALIVPEIERGFRRPTVQPYSVAAIVYVTDRLHVATNESVYATLRDHARAWFDGRNTAGLPVYDRIAGRVHDGVDDGHVSEHSGAESNIVGAQALFPEVARRASELLDEVSPLPEQPTVEA